MTGYTVCTAVLLLGGVAPALAVASRGTPEERLIGLELVSSAAVLFMLVLSQAIGQSFYLSVPLVLAPLSFAGTLVFTRLLGRRGPS
ncbi:MAG TPA: MrpF/PhaF family protein [Mycobacteriales bacterium]|nr:MrpF/PhaF family protein [Mycobacteriales bacterium]